MFDKAFGRKSAPAAAALAGLVMSALPWGLCLAETVALQQGTKGYKGCAAATLWEPKNAKPKEGVTDEVLYVRGTVGYRTTAEVEVDDKDRPGEKKKVSKTIYREASNRVLLKFDLPGELKGKKLARARLEVFVPEVRGLRMINEILCREVTQPWTAQADWEKAGADTKWQTPGGTLDEQTDYGNGRPAGAVDSWAFWEYAGQYFPHKYSHLQCPKGGKWIDFNVTPLAERWLAKPHTNHGVALEPITQGDKRFINRMEIDLPSPGAFDWKRRPRLVLHFEPLDEKYIVGMTHGLRKYCDRSPRYRFYGPFADSHEMAMARNDFEPFQVLVHPIAGELKQVTFEAADLLGPGGAKIPAADVTYNCQEMVLMHPNGKTGDWYFHGKRFWVPDPLSHPRPIDLPRHVSTPFWFTVRTRPQTRPGTYAGTVTVRPENAPPQTLKLTVKVWNYEVPERWNFQTMGQPNWSYFWQAYDDVIKKVADAEGREAAQKKRADLARKHIDFLMDHRFMPTSQYTGNMGPALTDIPYCVAERGGNTIYLNGNFRLPDLPNEQSPEIKKLTAAFEADVEKMLRAAGKTAELAERTKQHQADAAEASKNPNRRERDAQLQKLKAGYEADKIAMVKAAGKDDDLAALTRRHEADKAQQMTKLMAAYEAAKAGALKGLRDRYDAVVALDEKLRADGQYDHAERLIDMSLVYIGDETSDWPLMRRKSHAIRLACPELMIMIGGSFPREELDGIIDIYDPQIGGGSKTYSLTEQMTHLIAASQGKGERFFWYDAAGPMLPHPNVQCEEPLIAARVVFWMTWKYGVTGFEYYCYAIWSHNLPHKDKQSGRIVRWPEKPFTSWGWGNTNGDGMLYYPGPEGAFSSVRFENIRDGIEDWESHWVLRDYVDALKAKAAPAAAKGLLARAENLLKVPDEIVKDLTHWTWEPEVLLAAHRNLGDTIDELTKLVSEQEMLAARKARHEDQLRRQRDMLRRRAEAARKAAEKK